jgi:GNAT-family acetyltransferase (TIGR03103 family)
MSMCQDKEVTFRMVKGFKIPTPAQIVYKDKEVAEEFLKKYKRVVVKPSHGEQGCGISVDIQNKSTLKKAILKAQKFSEKVLIEQFVEGEDLRIIVINFEVVAAAVRRPAEIIGNGKNTVKQLIQVLSKKRSAATGGESKILLDDETLRCIRVQKKNYDSVLKLGEVLKVRKTANLHTGGTIHDVTSRIHPHICEAAEKIAKILNIPVVGLDFLMPDILGTDFVLIEANERPGLANHEPQPTAEKFIDFLFPESHPRTMLRPRFSHSGLV